MITIQSQNGILELQVRGKIDRHDMAEVRRAVDEHVRRAGTAPMLLWFEDFEGYASPQAFLDDMRLTAEHWSHIPRLALIGDAGWLDALRRAHAKLSTKTEIRHFERNERARARRWTAEQEPPTVSVSPPL